MKGHVAEGLPHVELPLSAMGGVKFAMNINNIQNTHEKCCQTLFIEF